MLMPELTSNDFLKQMSTSIEAILHTPSLVKLKRVISQPLVQVVELVVLLLARIDLKKASIGQAQKVKGF